VAKKPFDWARLWLFVRCIAAVVTAFGAVVFGYYLYRRLLGGTTGLAEQQRRNNDLIDTTKKQLDDNNLVIDTARKQFDDNATAIGGADQQQQANDATIKRLKVAVDRLRGLRASKTAGGGPTAVD
jgi:hypothetical protein